MFSCLLIKFSYFCHPYFISSFFSYVIIYVLSSFKYSILYFTNISVISLFLIYHFTNAVSRFVYINQKEKARLTWLAIRLEHSGSVYSNRGIFDVLMSYCLTLCPSQTPYLVWGRALLSPFSSIFVSRSERSSKTHLPCFHSTL